MSDYATANYEQPLARIRELEQQVERLRVERDTFSGTECANGQIEGKAPCGICVRCLAAERDRLREELSQATHALCLIDSGSPDYRHIADQFLRWQHKAALRREGK